MYSTLAAALRSFTPASGSVVQLVEVVTQQALLPHVKGLRVSHVVASIDVLRLLRARRSQRYGD
jgi:hypothetical protein